VPENGYLHAVLGVGFGLGAPGAHAKKRRPLDERVAARARLYRRSLAVTGIIWCAALVLDHAPPAASGLASGLATTTPNSVLVAATAAEGGATGAGASSASPGPAGVVSTPASAMADQAPGFRFVGRLAAEAGEAAGGASVAGEPINLELAAANCPGLAWQVLAAIAQVETGGGHQAVSPAGAVGPMQLLPATWARYRLDETASIDDFEDSAIAAARMLCADGAPGDLRRALWDYNHSQFYVDRVLAVAASLGAPGWAA
jgi:soluble lytic murein transglycosylase-like protein